MRNLIEDMWPEKGITTLLDLGCGDLWFTADLPGVKSHTGVDIWEPAIERAKAKNVPGFVGYAMDLREYIRARADNYFDAVLAIDVVEHFDEDGAQWLINQIDRVSRHLAVVWTTDGYIEQAGYSNDGEPNPYQEHRYGPTVDDFNEWHVDVYPEWHGDRGGGLFAYKWGEPIPEEST